ncbi:MAG: spermidine synthase [Aeromonas sp.]
MDFNLPADQPHHPQPLILHRSTQAGRQLTVQENAEHRWLEIDDVVQSAMSLRNPAALCLPHQHQIAALLPTQGEQILELGLGGGDLTRYLQHRWPQAQHHCVDLDEEVISLYRRFFQPPQQGNSDGYGDGDGPILHHADALRFLEHSEQQFDLILLDLFRHDGNPLQLFQQQLYHALAPRLAGTLIVNLLPRTAIELKQALTLLERWIGPTTTYHVPGYVNVIARAHARHTSRHIPHHISHPIP